MKNTHHESTSPNAANRLAPKHLSPSGAKEWADFRRPEKNRVATRAATTGTTVTTGPRLDYLQKRLPRSSARSLQPARLCNLEAVLNTDIQALSNHVRSADARE